MLPRNLRQEAFSRACIRAVAARAGVICGTPENDPGFDVLLQAVEVHNQQLWDAGPQYDVQLNSTARAAVRETAIAHDLDGRNYQILRQEIVPRPRILIVLLLPEAEDDWMSRTEDALILRRCAYWMSLRGAPPTTNQTTVRVSIPRVNTFSVQALRELMDLAKGGAMPSWNIGSERSNPGTSTAAGSIRDTARFG